MTETSVTEIPVKEVPVDPVISITESQWTNLLERIETLEIDLATLQIDHGELKRRTGHSV